MTNHPNRSKRDEADRIAARRGLLLQGVQGIVMTQFHEGQDVEVCELLATEFIDEGRWRKAKIVGRHGQRYLVQFADRSTADFDAEHIRAVNPEPLIHDFRQIAG